MRIQDHRAPKGGHALALVISITGLALALRLLWLGGPGLEYHELISARLSSTDAAGLWSQITTGRPPLYPALTWIWTQLAGTSSWALRLPSALFSTAAVPLVFLAGRRLFDGRVGVLAAVLMAISPFQIHFGQVHRPYGLMVLLGVTSVWLLLRALGVGEGGRPGGRPRDWVGYVAASTLFFYTQPMAIFTLAAVAAAMGVMTLRGGLRPRQQARFWGAQIAIIALALPWLIMPVIEVVKNAPPNLLAEGRAPWLAPPPWYAPVRAVVNFLVLWVGHLNPLAVAGGSALLALGALGTILRGRPSGRQPHGGGGFAGLWGLRGWVGNLGQSVVTGWWERERSWGLVAGWAVGPLLLGGMVSWTMKPVYLDHYFIPASTGVYVAVAALLVLARKTVPLRASFSALVVVMAGATVSYYRTVDRPGLADAVAWVGERRGPDERIVFASERGTPSEARHLEANWAWLAQGLDTPSVADPPQVSVDGGATALGRRLQEVTGPHRGVWLVVRRDDQVGRAWFPGILEGDRGGVTVIDDAAFGDLVVLRARPLDPYRVGPASTN